MLKSVFIVIFTSISVFACSTPQNVALEDRRQLEPAANIEIAKDNMIDEVSEDSQSPDSAISSDPDMNEMNTGSANPGSEQSPSPPGHSDENREETDSIEAEEEMPERPKDEAEENGSEGENENKDDIESTGSDLVLKARPTCLSGSKNEGLFSHSFKASDANPDANHQVAKGSIQQAYLNYNDARAVEKNCGLIIYLHGAGKPKAGKACFGDMSSLELMGSHGHHVLVPCYYSYYGISKCKKKVGECRLEAIEGVDHSENIEVSKEDGLEQRVISALKYLDRKNPTGNWTQFIKNVDNEELLSWDQVIVAGSSHGASSAALIAKEKTVRRAIMFSGPLDKGQAWTRKKGSMTSAERQYSVTCTNDSQHKGHLNSLETLSLQLPAKRYSNQSFEELRMMNERNFIVGGSCTHGNTGPRPKYLKNKSGRLEYLNLWKYLFFSPRSKTTGQD